MNVHKNQGHPHINPHGFLFMACLGSTVFLFFFLRLEGHLGGPEQARALVRAGGSSPGSSERAKMGTHQELGEFGAAFRLGTQQEPQKELEHCPTRSCDEDAVFEGDLGDDVVFFIHLRQVSWLVLS